MPYFKLIIWCWYVVIGFWLIRAFSNKRTVERESMGNRMQYAVLFWAGILLLNGKGSFPQHDLMSLVILPHSEGVDLVGLIITVMGLGLAIWARTTLGTNWSGTVTFKEGHELIERGPYGYVRHPIYTALLLMFLGTAVAVGTLGGLVGLGCFFLSFWIKYRQEEALMTTHFGERYRDYMRRVKALIPMVF